MKCKLCNFSGKFNELITLKNFPRSAQYFLKKKDISKDSAITLKVLQCPMCSLVQLNNKPPNNYKDVITAASMTENSKKNLINEFSSIIKKYNLFNSNVVEIGSAKGDFLEVIESCGLKVTGIENSKKSIQISRQKGKNVLQGYLIDGLPTKKKFGLAICNNFLEHQPNIKKFLLEVNSILKPEGHVYFSVPSLKRIVEKSCLYEFVSDHLVYFTKETLRRSFENSGFEVKDIYYKNNENDIVLIGRKRKLLDLSVEKIKMSEILRSLKEYVTKIKKKNLNISIWGAGHRSLAAMSLSKIKEIDFIVDSAVFKQGFYSPILHKKIISPEEFLTSKCDVIILMLPGDYSKQVEKFLKNNQFNGKIIAFKDDVI